MFFLPDKNDMTTSRAAPRLTFAKIERFMRYIDRDDVLQLILSVPENDRPEEAARLYNEDHPNDTITKKQATHIGNTYYWENGRICRLTPEIKAKI